MKKASKQKEVKADNRRAYTRFHDPDHELLHLFYFNDKTQRVDRHALVIDESYNGVACVMINHEALAVDQKVFLRETDLITSACTVIRCTAIEKDTYKLCFKRIEDGEGV